MHAPAPISTSTPALCVADAATFWPWLSWTDFAGRSDGGATLVVVPVVGMADWGLGHGLDLEETIALEILKNAAALVKPDAGFQLLTLPPLRFVGGWDPGCAFAAETPAAHRFIEEIVTGVAASGFTKVVFFNSSPWNEEIIDAAGRDLRITRGLQMFCVNLSSLGYDLHPTRSQTRRAAQTLATWLTAAEPEPVTKPSPAAPWPETEAVTPLPGPAATLAEADTAAPAMLAAAGAHLRSLLGEIAARPALAHGGAILPMAR